MWEDDKKYGNRMRLWDVRKNWNGEQRTWKARKMCGLLEDCGREMWKFRENI